MQKLYKSIALLALTASIFTTSFSMDGAADETAAITAAEVAAETWRPWLKSLVSLPGNWGSKAWENAPSSQTPKNVIVNLRDSLLESVFGQSADNVADILATQKTILGASGASTTALRQLTEEVAKGFPAYTTPDTLRSTITGFAQTAGVQCYTQEPAATLRGQIAQKIPDLVSGLRIELPPKAVCTQSCDGSTMCIETLSTPTCYQIPQPEQIKQTIEALHEEIIPNINKEIEGLEQWILEQKEKPKLQAIFSKLLPWNKSVDEARQSILAQTQLKDELSKIAQGYEGYKKCLITFMQSAKDILRRECAIPEAQDLTTGSTDYACLLIQAGKVTKASTELDTCIATLDSAVKDQIEQVVPGLKVFSETATNATATFETESAKMQNAQANELAKERAKEWLRELWAQHGQTIKTGGLVATGTAVVLVTTYFICRMIVRKIRQQPAAPQTAQTATGGPTQQVTVNAGQQQALQPAQNGSFFSRSKKFWALAVLAAAGLIQYQLHVI